MNNTKQWAFIALAFFAGFGVSRYGNFGTHKRGAQQHEARAKRAEWSKGVQERLGEQRGKWNRGDTKRRKKGENGPTK